MLTRKKADDSLVVECALLEQCHVRFWSSRAVLALKQRNLQIITLLLSLFFMALSQI